MHKHTQQISERAGELLSFFSVLPPFLLSSPSPSSSSSSSLLYLPSPFSTFPWKADRTVTGAHAKALLLCSPHHSSLVLIFLAIGID